MALYSGRQNNFADLISLFGINRDDVLKIAIENNIYKIGELRFLTNFRDNPKSVPGLIFENGYWRKDKSSSVFFDGWVYPDGSQFLSEDFPEAAEVFQSGGSEFFKVPDLTDMFFAGRPASPLKIVEGKNDVVGWHTHQFSGDNTASADSEFTIEQGFVFCASGNFGTAYRTKTYTTSTNGIPYTVPCFHSGTGDLKYDENNCTPFPMDLTINSLNVLFGDAKTENGADPGGEELKRNSKFVPPSRRCPVMIYIGPAKVNGNIQFYTVRFIDDNSTVLKTEFVEKGLSATPPELEPREHYTRGWDKSYDSIQSDTDINAVYEPDRYTVSAYALFGGTVKPVKKTVTYGDSAEISAFPANGKMVYCWNINGSETVTSDKFFKFYPERDSEVSVYFKDKPEHIGWQWKWEVEDNCDSTEQRAHIAYNIAWYDFENSLKTLDSEIPHYDVFIASNDLNSSNPHYENIGVRNREIVTLHKLYGNKLSGSGSSAKYQVAKRELYGYFTLDTSAKGKNGISAVSEPFFGYKFDTEYKPDPSVPSFVSPVGDIVFNGWQPFPDAESVSDDGTAVFNSVRNPELYPVTDSLAMDLIVLNIDPNTYKMSDGKKVCKSEVVCATSSDYVAFWGSTDPVFISEDQILSGE